MPGMDPAKFASWKAQAEAQRKRIAEGLEKEEPFVDPFLAIEAAQLAKELEEQEAAVIASFGGIEAMKEFLNTAEYHPFDMDALKAAVEKNK